ncbi:MAG TPA: glycosyltransferase family 4 protein [Casimicrobiaceae bacterium]|nr:glycosyltransferase family 4 protein [Casimicrobiaceae bacterium]
MIGYVTANLGLGVAVRGLITALVSKNFRVRAFDVDPGGMRTGRELGFTPILERSVDSLPAGLTIWVGGAGDLGREVLRLRSRYLRHDCYNVAAVSWELPAFTRLDSMMLGLFDAVLAPSQFIEHAVQFDCSGVRAIYATRCLPKFPPLPYGRLDFGLPERGTLFVTSFDTMSDLERKNPVAVLRAFIAALGTRENAWLVLKINNAGRRGSDEVGMRRLRAELVGFPRVIVIDREMTYQQTLCLYASCDVYVSLHRAEGVGLALLENMALGKPVIATAWSGNLSFMNESTSALVRYDLVPVRARAPQYRASVLPRGARWAEPHIDHAAHWMRRLHDDPDLRRRMGRAAQDAVDEHQRTARACEYMRLLMALREQHAEHPPRSTDRGARLAHYERAVNHALVHSRMQRRARKWLDRHLLWRFNRE